MKLNTCRYDQMKLGSQFSFTRLISKKDVETFAELSGDFSPLHVDDAFAKGTEFKGTVIHGMLGASLFSTLVGMRCPGKYALILSQELKYIKPIRPDSKVKVVGKVTNKIDAVKILVVKMAIYGQGGKLLVSGVSKVKMTK